MEDDDDFGDLYTDVLTPFSNPTPFQPPQPPRSEPVPPPIDNTPAAAAASISRLNSDDVLSATSSSNPRTSLNINLNLNPTINLNDSPPEQNHETNFSPSRASEDPPALVSHELRGVSSNSPPGPSDADAAETRVLGNLSVDMNTDVVAANHEGEAKLDQSAASEGVEGVEKGDNWGAQVEHEDDAPVIPGISVSQLNDVALNLSGIPQEEANDQGDDWDSDSEDDLQIVLNENEHPDIHHYQGPGAMGDNVGKVDDDDDEDEDGDPLVIVSDIDAVHHHPPPEEQGWGDDSGQAPDGEGKETGEAGKANGGVSMPPKVGYNSYGYHQYHSQFKYVRPGAAPLPGGPGGPSQVRPPVNMAVVGGRGRGDWRPVGMKPSLQKGFQSGFWGANASGRGYGADFTLPSQKTIFDISIDSFEEKPWNQPGADVSDYFNFGLNEDTWKEYCKKLEHLRMDSTMKTKAHVLVVGSQSEQEYDPDLPPELVAAAAGFQDPSAGNSNIMRADVGQIDMAKGSGDMRPVLPTGRPIQVETGAGERIPSIDTRPPRMRDPDSVIEIVLQGSIDDESKEEEEENTAEEEEEDGKQTRNGYSDGSPQSVDRTKENESSLPPESPIQQSSNSRDNKSPVSDKLEPSHGERRMKGKIQESSRSASPVHKFDDDKLEVSNENMEGSASPQGLSFSDDEPFETEIIDSKEKDDVISNENSTRKHKLGSHVDVAAAKESGRSSDNSYNNNNDDEAVQDEHSSRARDLSRTRRADLQSHHHHRKDRDESLEMTKRKVVPREGFDRRRERNLPELRKHDHADGVIARHRGKVRDKPVENGNWKDGLSTRNENMDDPHRKSRRDNFQQDEIARVHRKREESLDLRKRDDHHHRPIRAKDESWFQREQQQRHHRERESVPRREREPIRSTGRITTEEKGRIGHSRKDNYKGHERETGRNGEQLKRKERAEDASNSHYGHEEKRSRQDNKPIVRSDNQRAQERRPKENSRRPKQLEGGQQSNSLKKLQEDKIGRDDMGGLTVTTEEAKTEEASEDVEQHRSKKGRSKLERWGSHNENEREDSARKTQAAEVSVSASEAKETMVSKEKEHTETKHLDTVAKLKKRSERFKLPMPIEKDTNAIKKIETEPLSSAPNEASGNSEMKNERPPRKRRWISN